MGHLNIELDWKKHKWPLFYCFVSLFGAFCYGYDTIYYTGIQGMKSFILTASVIYAGEFCGALITAPINDAWGRKAVFYSASSCIITGAIVQVCASGIYGVFCAGRVLIGLGIGQFTATCLTYISEIAPMEIRGPALMSFQFMQSISQLIGACITQGTKSIDNANAYRIPMGLLMVLPGIMLVLLPFIPESPVWLVKKNRQEAASKSLQKIYRMTDYHPKNDLRIIQEQVLKEREERVESSWSSLIKDRVERRKLIYSCGAMFTQQINGIQFWYTYGVVFAQSIGVSQPFTINTITYVLQIIAVGMSVILGNKLRRRNNLLVCTMEMLFSLIAVGGLGTTHPGGPFTRGVGIAIVVFAYINIICFNFSIGTLSYTISSEMAVGLNRNKITACAMGVFFFTVWLITFVSPYLYYSANLGPMLAFIFGTASFICLAYIWFCVGETTGRSNADIQQLFAEEVPVRKWRSHVLHSDFTNGEEEAKVASLQEVELAISR
ncbi:Galactose transporter [Penicillium rolfsii]|nr:Galactose transporter [Penicillium rolfsii]